MSKDRVVFSSRVAPEIIDKIEELIAHYQKQSIGKVTKRDVLEKAISELHEKECRK